MNKLSFYIAKQIVDEVRRSRVVVWYDPQSEFVPFVDEIRESERTARGLSKLNLHGEQISFAEFDGSYFEIRHIVEPIFATDKPSGILIYVPGAERDPDASPLMEIEAAGATFQPQLKRLARNVLEQKYSLGQIDEILNRPNLTYQDLVFASSDTSSEAPSILKSIFPEDRNADDLLAAWIANDTRDVEILEKDAAAEITKLIAATLGVELSASDEINKIRLSVCRFLLINEFRSDLRCKPLSILDGIREPENPESLVKIRSVLVRLRTRFPSAYEKIADRIEAEFNLAKCNVASEHLGSIETFRFEELCLLRLCGEKIVSHHFDEALSIISERENCFWLSRNVSRRSQWEACRLMAELGKIGTAIQSEILRAPEVPSSWVKSYTGKNGWYLLDQAQRRLETWISSLEDDPEEQPLGVVRRIYDDTCNTMAEGFVKVLAKSEWAITDVLHQTQVFADVVEDRPKPVAYFLVDAMRFEMGAELVNRLELNSESIEVSIKPAISALPSITPIGMAALMPGASSSFNVMDDKGKFGAQIDGTFLPELTARKKFALSRIPKLVDTTLDELLAMPMSKLKKRLEEARVVIVRSQEIDLVGETGFPFHARQVMSTVIENIARGVRRLAGVGIENSVISADHGHLFFAQDRDESMRTDSPGGNQVDLHRRCWMGRGGATPAGCIRIPGSLLGYQTDLDFVFPKGTGVFRSGGDLSFHHGGPSLQELVIPVITVRLQGKTTKPQTNEVIKVEGLPGVLTNRIFSIKLKLGGDTPSLFTTSAVIRAFLMFEGRQVGDVGMAIDAEFDRTKGTVTLAADKVATVAFILTDESVPHIRVIVQDPTSDAELFRSSEDIPVRLGV